MFDRATYLNRLVKNVGTDQVKIITGLRRSGKSCLLKDIFREHLLKHGVAKDHIIYFRLDVAANAIYRDPLYLEEKIRSLLKDGGKYYVFIDEIQLCYRIQNPALTEGKHVKAREDDPDAISFVDTVLSLQDIPNVDIFVTGSNSKMLSSDILSTFSDKGSEIRVLPFSYSEYSKLELPFAASFDDYLIHGGMPHCLELSSSEEREAYLKRLIRMTYLKDIMEHGHFKDPKAVLTVLKIVADCVGKPLNVAKIAATYKSVARKSISENTVSSYLAAFEDAYLIKKEERYDIRGRKRIGGNAKYYFTDIGLRNAILSFAHPDSGQIMENLVHNELEKMGYSLQIGIVELQEKNEDGIYERRQYEVDFVAVKGNDKVYIQSAYELYDEAKIDQEKHSLRHIDDSFRKVVIVKDDAVPRRDEKGIITIGIKQFLSNPDLAK